MNNLSSKQRMRQVAIIIESLDRQAADQLLERFTVEQQRQIRDAVVELDAVTKSERSDVSRVFMGRLRQDMPEIEEVAIRPNSQQPDSIQADSIQPNLVRCQPPPPPNLAADAVYRLFAGEHVQTLTLVATLLAPAEAAKFIGLLPEQDRREVLQRLAVVADPDPVAMSVIQSRMSNHQESEEVDEVKPVAHASGIDRLQQIMSAAHAGIRSELFAALSNCDPKLAESLQQNIAEQSPTTADTKPHELGVAVDRLADLQPVQIEEVIRSAKTPMAALALVGASQTCLQNVFALLPVDLRNELQREMRAIGPVRLDDIQRAQQFLVDVARKIAPHPGPENRLKLSA